MKLINLFITNILLLELLIILRISTGIEIECKNDLRTWRS